MSDINFKTEWDLNILFDSMDDIKIDENLELQKRETSDFCDKRKNDQTYLISEVKLSEALLEYDKLMDLIQYGGRAGMYIAYLLYRDMDNAELQAKDNKINEISTDLANQLTFFELELSKIPEEKQIEFLSLDKLSPFKNYLKNIFRDGKFALSEKEEIVINKLGKVSYSNRVKIIDKLLSSETANIYIDGKQETKTFQELVNLSFNKNEETRKMAVELINNIYSKYLSIGEMEINSVIEFRKNMDELRSIPRPDLIRIYNDDLDENIVDALNQTIVDRFDISRRYYDLKAKLMGKTKILYNERNLVLNKNVETKIGIDEAVSLVGDVYKDLDEEFYDIYKTIFESGRVDVFPKQGKRGGAFCSTGIKGLSFVLLNFTGNKNDVNTIAHEFGHAIHFTMMKDNLNLNSNVGMFVAETPSTFCEDFVFQKMLEGADDEEKFNLIFEKIGDQINTIQRQIACYNFEKELHQEFKKKGYLGNKEIGELFAKWMSEYCGDSVECKRGFENRWIGRRHIRTYFYVYAYAGGLLISKSLQAMVKQDKNNLKKVKEFFRTGSAESPKDTFMKMGIDIGSTDFWNAGLDEMESDLRLCEELAKKLGKI